jgi:hypothetical protein
MLQGTLKRQKCGMSFTTYSHLEGRLITYDSYFFTDSAFSGLGEWYAEF